MSTQQDELNRLAGASTVLPNQAQQAAAHQQQVIQQFWNERKLSLMEQEPDFKLHALPLARIKKVMKSDEDSKSLMIASEAPIVFAKACEIFIEELTQRAWMHAEEHKRRTLQKQDISGAISKCDMYDFLIDIVPREAELLRAQAAKQPQMFYDQSATYGYYQGMQGVSQMPSYTSNMNNMSNMGDIPSTNMGDMNNVNMNNMSNITNVSQLVGQQQQQLPVNNQQLSVNNPTNSNNSSNLVNNLQRGYASYSTTESNTTMAPNAMTTMAPNAMTTMAPMGGTYNYYASNPQQQQQLSQEQNDSRT